MRRHVDVKSPSWTGKHESWGYLQPGIVSVILVICWTLKYVTFRSSIRNLKKTNYKKQKNKFTNQLNWKIFCFYLVFAWFIIEHNYAFSCFSTYYYIRLVACEQICFLLRYKMKQKNKKYFYFHKMEFIKLELNITMRIIKKMSHPQSHLSK